VADFISDNPALTSYYQTRNNDRAQSEGDIQLRQAQQAEGANNAIDADLRSWFAKGSQPPVAATPAAQPADGNGSQSASPQGQAPATPIADATAARPAAGALSGVGLEPAAGSMAKSAQTPGTGRYLASMNQGAVQRRQDMTFKMFDAMDKGDVPQAQYLARSVGFDLPPQAWGDVRTIRTLGQAKYFQPLYKDDEPHFGAFLSDAMRSADGNGGTPDWQGALQRNPPRSAIETKVAGVTAALGHRPQDAAIEAMAGGRLPFAFGAPVPTQGPDGTVTYVQPSRVGGPARQVVDQNGEPVSAAARPVTDGYSAPVVDANGNYVQPSRTGGPARAVTDANGNPIAAGAKPQTGAAAGREAVFNQRVILSANQAAKDLANVVQLPIDSSTGFFGGRKQGGSLMSAGKEVLANTMTGQDVQAYNAMATGFQRSLAAIESAGLMPSGSLTHQMDAVLFKEGDTNLTKMHKLAQTRQIVESGLEVMEANPRISGDEKAKIAQILENVRTAVPFTHSDLIKLRAAQQTNPDATMQSIMPKGSVPRADQGPANSGPTGAATLPPAAQAQLQEGHVTTFANGQKWTLANGIAQQVQ